MLESEEGYNPLIHSWQPGKLQLKIMQCQSRATLVIAGNRFGKTSLGMRRMIHAARGDYPYAPLPQGNAYWILCPSKENFREVHKPIFDEWCPPDWLIHFDNMDMRATILRKDGSEATIKWWSYEHDHKKLVGKSLDGCWLDEPPPREHYRECWARLTDRRGWMWMTMTPVEGIGWWGEEIYEPAKRGEGPWTLFQAALAERDELNAKEFWVGEPLIPHLDRDQLIHFASAYPDEDELAIRIFGEVRSRRGLVYKDFMPDVHVVPEFKMSPDFDIWGAIDPGWHGFACVIAAIDRDQRITIVREHFSQMQTAAPRLEALEKIVRQLRPDPKDWDLQYGEVADADVDNAIVDTEADVIVLFYVDTAHPELIAEYNMASIASCARQRDAGVRPVISLVFVDLQQGLKAIKAGITRVQRLLHPMDDRRTPHYIDRDKPEEGEPRMYFADSLNSQWRSDERQYNRSRLIWEMEQYEWKPPPTGSYVKRDEPNDNSADGAHMMDALRYLVMARTGPAHERAPESKRRRDPWGAPAEYHDVVAAAEEEMNRIAAKARAAAMREPEEEEAWW